MSETLQETTLNQLTLLPEDFHARMSALPADGRALLESGQDYGSSLRELLANLSLDESLSKTSPVFFPRIGDGILKPSSARWLNSGMAFPGGFLTLNSSEFPSDAVASSLSEVLETDAPQKYFLSAKGCAGILRRAAEKGRNIPDPLRTALQRARDNG